MSGTQAAEPLPVKKNKELHAKIERFLDLLHRHDAIGKNAYYKQVHCFRDGRIPTRDLYGMRFGRKYIWIEAPYLRFAVTARGNLYYPKNHRSRSDRLFAHIDELLDEAKWGKQFRRVYRRVKRGLGMRYESSYFDLHDLVLNGGLRCGACGRTTNVEETACGPRCQYCRASDTRHMNTVRQLGGTPNVNGRPLPTNAAYRKGG
jgi:hypothetical protein